MRVLKWLFLTLTLLCFLLWTANFSNNAGYILNIGDDSNYDSIASVNLSRVGENDFFKFNKYRKMTTKLDELKSSTMKPRHYGGNNDKVSKKDKLDKRANIIWKTFYTKSNVGENKTMKSDSETYLLNNPLDAREKIVNKALFDRKNNTLDLITSAETVHMSPSLSSTTTAFNKGKQTQKFDHVGSESEGTEIENGTEHKGGYKMVHQKGDSATIQHTRTLDSRQTGYQESSSNAAKRKAAANGYGSGKLHPSFWRHSFDIPVGSSTDYAVPDIQSLRIDKTQNSTFVLLVTYARSGSTWLGEIVNQANQSFYVFEPLQKFIVQGYYKQNLVCYNNNTSRKPRIFTETYNFAITTFHRLFTCQLTKLHPKAIFIFIKNLKSRNYGRTFKSCVASRGTVTKCLQQLENVCLTTTHRILKTIRISMELVNIMMNLWPNLKVVHLVRDPRGITNSRLNSRTFSMAKQLESHSKDLCTRMLNDVQLDDILNEKHVNRLIVVFYESLAERPLEGAKFLYKFLDMKLTKDVIKWVYNSTHAQKKTGYFGTMRSDSVKSAFQWRSRLTLYKIKTIDAHCIDIYNRLEYITLSTTEELLNNNITTRRSLNKPNWFS